MTFSRPTLATLIKRAQSDFETRLPGADALLRDSVESVLSRVSAGGTHGLHGHLVWLSRQIMPDTAEAAWLARWASAYDINKKPAEEAQGPATFTGTNGTVLPADTVVAIGDIEYTTDAAGTVVAGDVTVDVTAKLAGTDGNASAGTVISLVSPVAGIDSDGVVAGGGIVDGIDEETDAALLGRLLLRIQTPPTGGGPGDYVAWALEVSGVTRAWEYPAQQGYGTVGLTFVMDDQAGSIIPGASKVAAVQAHIDAVCPITAELTVWAPTAVALDVTFTTLTPNTTPVQTAVEAEFEDLLFRAAEPGATILLSQINEAASVAAGETNHVITIPAADVTHATAEIAVPGTNTYPP